MANQLEEINFVDSYKVFSYHDSKYGELLKFLYENASFLAALLVAGESGGGDSLDVRPVVGLAVSSVFGHCLFQEDERHVLTLLKSLLHSQVRLHVIK